MKNEKPKIFYKIEGALYRNLKFEENDLIKINKEFREKTAKESREKAFSYYSSLLEVLLESIGLKYQNNKQAERDLSRFYFSNKSESHPKLSYVIFDNDIDKLITISFCSTKVSPYITKNGLKIYDDEKVIQAFGYESFKLSKKINNNLKIEHQFLT